MRVDPADGQRGVHHAVKLVPVCYEGGAAKIGTFAPRSDGSPLVVNGLKTRTKEELRRGGEAMLSLIGVWRLRQVQQWRQGPAALQRSQRCPASSALVLPHPQPQRVQLPARPHRLGGQIGIGRIMETMAL